MEETQQNQSLNNNPVGFPGQPPVQESPKKNWKWLVILILFLVVIGGVTFFIFKSSRSASSLDESPTPDTSSLTNVITAQPTPTPVATAADKSQIKIQVLNGTGIAGEAGILATQLKDLGYTDVTTGNAPTQNSTNTQVTFSTSVPADVVTEITGKLNELYTNITTNNSTLSGFDIQVTTGLRKGQTAAPDATDAPEAEATETPTASPTATP